LARRAPKGPTDSSDGNEKCARSEQDSRFSRVSIQFEEIECHKQCASDAHRPVNHVLDDKNRLTKVVGGSVKVLHLLIGHAIPHCDKLRPFDAAHVRLF
jgi:hypothetical protein